VDWLPLVALLPLQPPEAVQLVALVELQLRVEEPPLTTEVGLAVIVTVGGAGGVPTETVTVWLALPPAPEQANVKLVVALSAPVDWLPLVAFVPPQPPEAVQPVALAELQVSVEADPLTMVVGLAESVTVGKTGEGCGLDDPSSDAEPPEPPHPHDTKVARTTAIRVRICSASSLC